MRYTEVKRAELLSDKNTFTDINVAFFDSICVRLLNDAGHLMEEIEDAVNKESGR